MLDAWPRQAGITVRASPGGYRRHGIAWRVSPCEHRLALSCPRLFAGRCLPGSVCLYDELGAAGNDLGLFRQEWYFFLVESWSGGGRVVAGAVRLVGEFMEAVPHGGLRKMVFLEGR